MMRTLAEFVIRGRFQAIVVALVGSIIPLLALLTPSAIGLVTLRKGWQEGTFVTVWVIIAIAVVFAIEGVGSFAVYLSVGAIFVACCVANVLRYTVSWSAALAAIVALSMLVSLLASATVDSPSEGLISAYQTLLDAQPQETREQLKAIVSELSAQIVIGAMAFSIAVYALMGILLARWWQAMLYNPGGLKQEMHQLRLTVALAVACLLGFAYCEWKGEDYFYWQMLVIMPLLVAGLCLCHWLVAKLKWGAGPLVALYIALVLFPPFVLLVVVFGFTDVWIDYRKRINLMQR
ncbi:hypothetical protein [Teredinibacter haidensis]|uniref:hypothetical protein n=1 Tax=Teredinibacter haidensis TaxID=2731755 RepID=UPI0009FA6669|nr:hypothetical protein [Teredinibacter haidensis]